MDEFKERDTLMIKQRYLLPAVVIILLMMGVACGAYEYKGTHLDPPLTIPPFELNSTTGQPMSLADLQGQYSLIYFGYTFCPDVCPTSMADITEALEGLEGRDRVQVIFISVDPDRDTVEVLRDYVTHFDPSYLGLTDDYAKIQEIMTPFGAYAEKEEASGSATSYLVSHTARVYLLNPQGELILTYPYGFEPRDLRSDLAYLLEQE